MVGRSSLVAALAGAAAAHFLPRLPLAHEWAAAAAVLLAAWAVWWLGRRLIRPGPPAVGGRNRRYVLAVLASSTAASLGVAWVCLHTEHRLAQSLSPADEDKVSRVVLRVETLPRVQPGSRRFEATILQSRPEGLPARIQVAWHAPDYAGPYSVKDARQDTLPEVIPGQLWRMSLNLRRPHGLANPHGFDYEGHMFAQGLRAAGTVRGEPQPVGDDPWATLSVVAERARHHVRKAMAPFVQEQRYGAVLLALTIGDQAGVSPADWQVFNRTSITHLISISGSHITMIAALGGMLTLYAWKRLAWRGRPLAERVPAQVAACLVALLVAWLYCLLAGWGVPARRTFLMLVVLAIAHLCRLPLGPWRVLLLAAAVVVIMDPWALMASGFWLSFGAVGVLLTSGRWLGLPAQDITRSARVAAWLRAACLLQLSVTAGLMPVLAWWFNELSMVSPLANAYAIPVISLVVTPMSLLLAAVATVPILNGMAPMVAWLAHEPLRLMMMPTDWLSTLPAASLDAAAAPTWSLALAACGLGIALVPRGLPWRASGWLLIVPSLIWKPERPPYGGWDMVALDVGQGSAVLIQTATRSLLFDTGIRYGPDADAASRSIVPFLRAHGVHRLDVLVVSHADIDHVGGLRSVLQSRPVQQSYSSFDMTAHLRREAALLNAPVDAPALPMAVSRCRYGTTWVMDGVSFEFLWPLDPMPLTRQDDESRHRNAQSCVLRIRGKYHYALLTGDISEAQEAELVARDIGPLDVVVAAHHGSRSSSGDRFVEHVLPLHVVAQAGKWNRYGHPHPAVQRRWQRAGAQFWRSDLHGAVTLQSRPSGIQVEAFREARPRHWRH